MSTMVPPPTDNQLRGPQHAKPISRELAASFAPQIMQTVKVNRATECWERTQGVNRTTGYSYVRRMVDYHEEAWLAHRIMYVFWHGEIAPGLTIDHLCDNPPCCNPAHLRAVTHRENVLRSESNPCAINSRKVFCNNGHLLETLDSGRRVCPCSRTKRHSRARNVAICSWCEQEMALRTNGLIRKHVVQGGTCPGSGQPPREASA